MIRTQIYVPEPVHQAAKMLASRQNKTLAELLRYFIVSGLLKEKKKIKPKSLTPLTKLNITGGPKDLSSKMDKYLYE
ncbi:hypothetical protein KKF11_02315 [Patescibacteria group bacterium]|nr:hypothetical protein [Patescibacteria group bacterium]